MISTLFVYFLAVGDSVTEDEVVCEIETDKVAKHPRTRRMMCFCCLDSCVPSSRPQFRSLLQLLGSSRSCWCLMEGK